jgi:hypothetical protein
MRITEIGLFGLVMPYIGSEAVRVKEYVFASIKSLAEIYRKEFPTI